MANDFSAWIGRKETTSDLMDIARANALHAALGKPDTLAPGDALPYLYHWLYFWDVRPSAGLSEDGHPTRGGFLPPVPLPRRMWAGGRLEFLAPLRVGERISRVSTIRNVEAKSGRSGDLVFVTVEHQLTGTAGLAVIELQNIVYRDAAPTGSVVISTKDVAPAAVWARSILPDPVLLFRYSALTMNGHRIHYDRNYAISNEGYPGLVVHGPLQATLLIDLANSNLQSPITKFEFRGQSPAFDGAMLHVCGEPTGDGALLWTEQRGVKNLIATVEQMGARSA